MQTPTFATSGETPTFWYGGSNPPPTAVGGGQYNLSPAPAFGAALLRPGTLLAGRYRVEQPLGEGAFARVYAAWDNALGRWVAVKIYPAGAGGRISREEAQLQATCQHPNLMPLYDAGEDPLLQATYIVMPLYPGADLAATLNRYGPMPFRPALLCIDQICSALEFLQQRRGVVHGDIKPANLWLTTSGAALLMDFNLPGLLARADCGRAGTPGYTAPEALLGRMEARSDVFSLACVLYQCLTGTAPFADDNAVCAGKVAPLGRLRPEIRPELAAVIHRALAAEPEERFQSAREFQTALRHPATAVAQGRFATNAILWRLWRGVCWGGRLLGKLYRLLWRLSTRFLRHAVRRPAQALIELVLCTVLGHALLTAAQNAVHAWIAVHRHDLLVAGWIAAALGAVGAIGMAGSLARTYLGKRKRGGR
jgi:hypothetical protein